MEKLADCKEIIHNCSKCGLCQSVCPIYKITGNDCSVSRGQFIMLKGLIKGDLKMSKTINRYLDLCLKCGACSKFCPSGIDVVDVITLAKAEYFKQHFFEKVISLFQKFCLSGLYTIKKIIPKKKSETFEKKVIYFAGCGECVGVNGVNGVNGIIKIMNSLGVEVIIPDFHCCGIPFFSRGDIDNFKEHMNNFYDVLNKYGDYEIVTTCASCEMVLKSYSKWGGKEIKVKNIFEYIRENDLTFELKEPLKVTFHKPCHINNYDDIKWILDNTKNLEYIEMADFDKCCGLNGVTKLSEYKILSKLYKEKHDSIIKTNAKIVLTSCVGCKIALSLFSFAKYKVMNLTEFFVSKTK